MNDADILIVEDDGIIALDLKNRLQRAGYGNVEAVNSGEKALERIDRELPDLILMDIVMKDRFDGIESVAEMRRRGLSVAVIYLTAFSDEATITRAKTTEPHGYLIKPVKDHELFTAVDLALIKIGNERRELHLQTVLKTLINMHRLFIRCRSAEELLHELCAMLTTGRGYRSAWIMLMDDRQVPGITVMSENRDEYLNLLAQAIRNGSPPGCLKKIFSGRELIVIENSRTFCSDCPMAGSDERTPISVVAIRFANRLLGILTIALPHDFHVNPEEQQLLVDIAADIGYALDNFVQQRRRRAAEAALKRNRDRLREAQEIVQLGYWEVDLQTGAVSGSDQAYAILERDRATSIRTREEFRNIIHPDDRNRAKEAMDGLLNNNRPYDLTYRVFMPDNRVKYIHMKARLHTDRQGKPIRLMGTMQDITTRKKMEKRLLQTEKMATIAGLAAGVAHELNTPLSAVLQSLQIIELALDPDKESSRAAAARAGVDLHRLKEYFSVSNVSYFMNAIRDSAIRASKIINNLLQFSRPREGEKIRVPIRRLIDNTVELAQSDYSLKKDYNILATEIAVHCAPELEDLLCIPMEIEQALLNLIKNSAHALAAHRSDSTPPRITLRAVPDQGLVCLEVEDNGCGIDERDLPHVFEPFFTTKETGTGTGLGLSVVYGIVHDNHNGSVDVVSTPGKGTTVILRFPNG